MGDGGPPFPSTSKQNNRRTNIATPYTRVSMDDKLRPGMLCFVNGRVQPSMSKSRGHHMSGPPQCGVFGIDHVNEELKANGPLLLNFDVDKNSPPFAPTYAGYPLPPHNEQIDRADLFTWLPEHVERWTPDGVVNVCDDEGLVNVTVQGPSILVNDDKRQRCCSKQDVPLTRLYVGLRVTEVIPYYEYIFSMELFSGGMIGREDVKVVDNRAPNSLIIKAWQYGTVMDTRHVESFNDRQIVANVFVQPPIVQRPEQLTTNPRIGNIYRSGHLSPPNGLVWRRVDGVPLDASEYTPVDKSSGDPVDIVASIQLKFPLYPPPSVIEITQVEWEGLDIKHDESNPTLFYNMYLMIYGDLVYVPVPDFERGDRKGAFPLPRLSHGKWPKDRWHEVRKMPNPFPPGAGTFPAQNPPPTDTDPSYGRRPGWTESMVYEQLHKREVAAYPRKEIVDAGTATGVFYVDT